MTSDGHWEYTRPDKIWGPRANQLATNMIQWRNNETISMADWMDPTILATLDIKDPSTYNFHMTNDMLMYVLVPVASVLNDRVETITDNLTYKVTKPSWTDTPLQEGFASVQLHKYVTKQVDILGKLKKRFLADGFNIHYGLIPYEAQKVDKTNISYRHDMRQLMTGSQSYIQTHNSGTVSPTIIPQMDIRFDMMPTGKGRLQIQGTQLGAMDYTMLYIWVLPVEDRDYTGNIGKLTKISQNFDSKMAQMELELTAKSRLIELNKVMISQLKTQVTSVQTASFKSELEELKEETQHKIGEMALSLKNGMEALQSQMQRLKDEKTDIAVTGGIKEISYYVKGRQAEIPYTGQPETGLVPGGGAQT